MHNQGFLRHQAIDSYTAQHPTVDVWIASWERVAAQIILLVGVGGFESLFSRSVYLSQPHYPWLSASAFTAKAAHPFADLKLNLQSQPQNLASQANYLLLVTFTDLLASLIGEPLMASTLDSVWSGDAFTGDSTESNNAP